ncbi:MAG: transposase [Anaerolineae bacterium]|nr:MAG: transposase [Anaerolineae bacterium]
MEEAWIRDRSRLRMLLQAHPTWSVRQYAEAVGRSRKWVQKWKKRLNATDPSDTQILMSQSRARKTRPEPYHPAVIARILELRDEPPPSTPRRLGAPAILYYLHQDKALQTQHLRLPRSTSTIWKILDAHQRILRFQPTKPEPFERPAPLETWEIDFTDVSSATPVEQGKRQHWVEALAVVDRGTSILVDLQAASDYQAPSALRAIASTLIRYGLPQRMVFDRDPRWVGSWSGDQFPSAFMRFLLCLGIQIEVCPPQRPDRKPFVERYFRTLQEECVNVHLPTTATAAQAVFETHQTIYNHERPNQARVCGNQPPYVAFPRLPILPTLPDSVDPNRWLLAYHLHLFKRRVRSNGTVTVDKHDYYIGRAYRGRYLLLRLEAHQQALEVLFQGQLLKQLPLKGLVHQALTFDAYLQLMMQEAEAEWRRYQQTFMLRTG